MSFQMREDTGPSTTDDQQLDLPVPDTQDREGRETILDLISGLHLSSDYSDLRIICEDKIFPAHKLVVCSRSKYFHKACFAGFKETKASIHLDEKSPVLIEKMLEFLYTGNYTLGCRTTKVVNPQTDYDEGPRNDTENAGKPLIDCPSGKRTIDGHAAEMTADGFFDGSSMNEKQAPVHEPLEEGPIEKGNIVGPAVDILADCHPCYFHVRMYGEADYFMISDLKGKAKEKFLSSFLNCSEKESFSETIAELYSTRANYRELRKLAVEVIVDNLPLLRKGFTPVIDSKLMKSVPDFAIDLCIPAMDKYVSEPPNMKPYPFPSGFEYKGVDYMLRLPN
ncbi:hypothetical protein ASPWEDRAFT_55550 [Aspergillus wentii DTO 134E9]|uniref:BTB domain-containing protein n=1 Tax=Aspergillus wentii DTO 134E9 TaxID=1073089 RepID=A0A1L9R3T3_ASPWE|nr:uncharacterized protein ASPWEDRAFT_55550 [Aspergillus wentii DTO 134E9]KAI9923370.1 hypothetical protein MW887_009940 [Aspergillus wentii]OJJ29578.1 hypothetical protein ASPWEDRAFT_55550 [Aspergillus wentii DTO 134E9]